LVCHLAPAGPPNQKLCLYCNITVSGWRVAT
jgi:hypothetical protein